MARDITFGSRDAAAGGGDAQDLPLGISKLQQKVQERLRARAREQRPVRPNPFDSPEGRAEQWEQFLHLLGYEEIPPELSAEVLEKRFAAQIEADVRARQDEEAFGADDSRFLAIASSPLRWLRAFWREPFDLPTDHEPRRKR